MTAFAGKCVFLFDWRQFKTVMGLVKRQSDGKGSLGGKAMKHCRNGSSQGDPDEGQERNHQSDKVEIVNRAMHRAIISMVYLGIRKIFSKFKKAISVPYFGHVSIVL